MIGGVDTHKHTHYAAVIDDQGRFLGHQEFPATDAGYIELLRWMHSHGDVRSIGAESTGSLACRWKALDEEIKVLSEQIAILVRETAPELVELHGVGVEIAGQFLVTAGDNPERIYSEAAFANLCGVAPQPASSGRTNGRHRLSRSGDRAANSALCVITIVGMRLHQPTRDYLNDAPSRA